MDDDPSFDKEEAQIQTDSTHFHTTSAGHHTLGKNHLGEADFPWDGFPQK